MLLTPPLPTISTANLCGIDRSALTHTLFLAHQVCYQIDVFVNVN
jgi:hypothetical protein